MKKILVVGVNGFAGKHLVQYLSSEGQDHLVGTVHGRVTVEERRFLGTHVRLHSCDIRDPLAIRDLLRKVRPDQIYYLAAAVGHSMEPSSIDKLYDTNISATGKFYHAVRDVWPDVQILSVGSAEVYGKVEPSHLPVRETEALNPINPYGLSKKLAEEMGQFYMKTFGLDVRFTRTFHYSGPMQPPTFAISDFARQVAQIEKGTSKFLRVGSLDAKRDFTDIRDVVRAYAELMRLGQSGAVYNVCSGRSITIGEIVSLLSTNSTKRILIKKENGRLRPLDVPEYRGDNSLLKQCTHWKMDFTLETTIIDVLKYWRTKVK